MVKPLWSSFRMITTNFQDNQKIKENYSTIVKIFNRLLPERKLAVVFYTSSEDVDCRLGKSDAWS